MKVAVYTNKFKDSDLAVTRKILAALSERGVRAAVTDELRREIDCAEYFSIDCPQGFDFMITAGGDGTVLKVAKVCAEYDVPVMGINLGHVGFLAEEEPDKLDEAITALIDGNFTLESRALLRAEAVGKSFAALNDVVISRLPQSRILEIDVYVNDEFADRFHSDGYIVATPTGSTAYSLSAGGSILCPGVGAFILTPINSHSLHSRPLVVSENDCVTIKPHGECSLVVDGIECARLNGDSVRVIKNEVSAKFVRLREHGFYGKLLGKLNKWSVTDEEKQ